MRYPTSISGLLKGEYVTHLASDNWYGRGRKRLWAELRIDEENSYSLWFVVCLGEERKDTQNLAEAIRRYDEA